MWNLEVKGVIKYNKLKFNLRISSNSLKIAKIY